MSKPQYLGITALTAACVTFPATAANVYSSEALFVAAAGTAQATLPIALTSTPSFTASPFTFSSAAGQTFVVDTPTYGQPIPDENNLLVNGYESQTLVSAVPLYAFGFKIFQPSNAAPSPGPNGVACYVPCDRGSFTVTLLLGAVTVDSFTFTPAFNTVEFHGYAGMALFNRVSINDDLGTIDNEYFSTYRYSTQPVPELSTWMMSISGLALLLLV